MDYMFLKSGTDIRGVASDGVPGEKISLTDEAVEKIAAAFLVWCERHTGKSAKGLKIAIGHDSRISAERILECLKKTFMRFGATVLDCGLSSTPSMFMAIMNIKCDVSVQITASHHPFNRNGLKFFTPDGGFDSSDIEEVLRMASNGEEPSEKAEGHCEEAENMKLYCEGLREMIKKSVDSKDYEKPLKGFKIVVDAGNGAGGFYATEVLKPLGADISGSQFLEPDGMFPNHIPNPENEEAMRSVCSATLKAGADLGVIFDTDVDRGGAVDNHGDEINRNRLVAIASAIALEGNEGGTIVTDSITSDGLKEYIEKTLQGVHCRFKRGYKNVINEAIRLNKENINCPLAIETSGHAAMRENYFLDDGAYLVTKIIIKAAKLRQKGLTLENLLEPLKEPSEACEIRIKITDPDFRTCGNSVIERLEKYAQKNGWAIAPDSREGIRISFGKEDGDGWFLLRLSVHDPILPLNIESNSKGGVELIKSKLRQFFGENAEGLKLPADL